MLIFFCKLCETVTSVNMNNKRTFSTGFMIFQFFNLINKNNVKKNVNDCKFEFPQFSLFQVRGFL